MCGASISFQLFDPTFPIYTNMQREAFLGVQFSTKLTAV